MEINDTKTRLQQSFFIELTFSTNCHYGVESYKIYSPNGNYVHIQRLAGSVSDRKTYSTTTFTVVVETVLEKRRHIMYLQPRS